MKKRYSIHDFTLASPEEASGYAGGHGILGGSPRGISPFVVYKFLKEHFGRPTYVDPDDSRVTWSYTLKGPKRYLAVYDWKLYDWAVGIRLPWSMVQGKTRMEDIHKYDEEAKVEANILLEEILRYAKKVKIPIAKHSYQIIENTYETNYSYGQHFLKSLDRPKNDLKVPFDDQSFIHAVFFEECCAAWAAIMSFILSVEALFNILFEVYLNKEIRGDNVLRQRMFRLSLQDKWLLSASFCTCFARVLDRRSQGYQSLQKLIRIRNNWAHATISNEMRTYLIRDGELMFATKNTPIYKEKERAYIYPRISSVDYASAIKVQNDVDTIKSEMLSAMRKNDRKKFEKAMEEQYICLSRKGNLVS